MISVTTEMRHAALGGALAGCHLPGMTNTQTNRHEPVIEVRSLRCRYGDFEAVRGVSFEVRRGELFALLGTNGAGKTTTMETIEGHRPADGGAVRVLGLEPRHHRREVRPRTGIMLQHSGFVGELTVAETVAMWARLRSRGGDPDQAIADLDLEHRRDVRVSQLSGGEQRRLDLAMAVLGDPDVLFLDEPTTGLDPESRHRVWELIRSRGARGTTVLLTTHYLEEAEALADRVGIMHEGRLALVGGLDELVSMLDARIGFDLPDGVSAPDLPDVVGSIDRAALRQGRVEYRTPALQRDLAAIIDWAQRRGLELGRLRAHHASLDDLFAAVSQGAVDASPAQATSSRSDRLRLGSEVMAQWSVTH